MTDDDVRQAAERCRDFAGPGWVDLENASPECLADLFTLARAYLALAPVLAECRRFADGHTPERGWIGTMRVGLNCDLLGTLTVEDVRRAAGGDQPAGAG